MRTVTISASPFTAPFCRQHHGDSVTWRWALIFVRHSALYLVLIKVVCTVRLFWLFDIIASTSLRTTLSSITPPIATGYKIMAVMYHQRWSEQSREVFGVECCALILYSFYQLGLTRHKSLPEICTAHGWFSGEIALVFFEKRIVLYIPRNFLVKWGVSSLCKITLPSSLHIQYSPL